MELFLVKGVVYVTEYKKDGELSERNSWKEFRLVRAINAEEAKEKYEKYWHDKTEEYSVYYRASCEVMETIE